MPVEFAHTTLENGLQVIAEIDPHAHTSAIGFFVRTGARDEAAPLMGVSHFLEHMMFKGTATRTAEDVDREFDAIGAEHNAYTTSELTAFYAHCLPEFLPTAEEILSDILRPSLRGEDFDAEKKVILEEIAMYRDQPFWVLYEEAMERYYGRHPLAHRVLGTEDTITGMTRDQMATYFDDRYSADKTVLAMAGRIDFDAMVERLRSHCGGWTRTDSRRQFPEATFEPGELTLESATSHQHYLLMVCPGPPVRDDRRYAAAMLMQIFGDGDGSRLHWALIEPGLADEAHGQYDGRDGLGEMLIYAVCSPDMADRVESVVRRELGALVASLTEDDLQRVKSKVATGATLQGELPAGRMRRLGRVWTYLGEYRSLEEELARIDAVTLDELRDVARDYPLDELLTVRLRPEPRG
ncbi:MAG: M16 family metallopeptidase [Planctomycetota bacterium]|jgi:predicted Zn-dependent peptidase